MRKYFAFLAAFSLTVAAATPSRADLIVNGSFEATPTPLAIGSWAQYTSIPGWYSPTNNLIEVQSDGVLTGGLAQDGHYYAELNPIVASSLAQDVTTTAGDYLLSFYWSSRPDTPNAELNKFQVSFGTSQPLVYEETPVNTPGIPWKHVTAIVHTDTNGVTTLRFDALSPLLSYGTLIDNVTLTAVPEPATLAMTGIALVTVGGFAWRRKRRSA